MRALGLGRGVRVDEQVLVVAGDRKMLALQLLCEVGALRAQAVLEQPRELLARPSSASSTLTLQSSATRGA